MQPSSVAEAMLVSRVKPVAAASAHTEKRVQQKPASPRMHAEYLKRSEKDPVHNFQDLLYYRHTTHDWLAKWVSVASRKLNVVILPVIPVKYCRQVLGGLEKRS